MADNNSSNGVAILAIVIIVLLAAFAFWYFVNHGGMKTATDATKIEVKLPSSDSTPAKSD